MKYALFVSYTLAASARTIDDSNSGTSTAPRK